MPRTLKWDQISRAAASMFKIWTDQPELKWAKSAWAVLTRRGLAIYADECERMLVLVRLMTLATLYGEFCQVAWGEPFYPEYSDWADELDMRPFRIAQLVGPTFQRHEDLDTNELVEQGLDYLVEWSRRKVYLALKGGFGGNSALFVSLWISNWHKDELKGRTEREILDDVLNDTGDCFEKMPAFEWVSNGMPGVQRW